MEEKNNKQVEREENVNSNINSYESSSPKSQDVSGMDFLLFLILILLLLGNQNTFNSYFQIFDNEVNKLSNMLNAFQSTAEGLKQTFSTSYNFQK